MSAFQHYGKGIVRVAKNYTKGYSDVQSKVRDATSNDPWGPSGTQMNELAQMTYNQNDFVEIMEMLDKRLNDKGKNWRHVFKSLTVLDYLLHAGSENVVIYFRDNLYIIKTLKEFQFLDEEGKDQGANVRQKAKDISNLLTDESRLRQERRSRAHMRDRMTGGEGGSRGNIDEEEFENENVRRRSRSLPAGRKSRPGDDDDLKKAIEESKRTAAEEQAKNGNLTAEERDLQRAIQLSEEEEKKRAEALANTNSSALFDDQNQLINLAAPNPNPNNPFPIGDQQQQFGLQPQFTQLQSQYTAFNPYAQQAQQEAMQAVYQRQQEEWMRQQQDLQAQQQAQLQAQQQQQQQEEWMRQQQMLQYQQQQQLQAQQPMMAQPTGFGTNNPFASMSQTASPMPSFAQSSPPQQSQSPVSFNLGGTYANGNVPNLSAPSMSPPPQSASAPPMQRGPTRADQDHAQLANLLANRDDGQDTFGNFGQLRYGTQAANFLGQTNTGTPSHNPFAMQQQQQQQGNEQPFFSI